MNKPWFACPEAEMADAVEKAFNLLETSQEARHNDIQRYVENYLNEKIQGFKPGEYEIKLDQSRISWNLTQSCVDTMVAQLAADKIKPLPLTNAGDFAMQRRAQNLDRVLLGQFEKYQVYKHGGMSERDGCVAGDGYLAVYADPEERKICVERWFTPTVYFDPIEAMDGEPRVMYHTSDIPLYRAIEMYPEYEAEFTVAATTEVATAGLPTDTRTVRFIQAWRLPPSKKKAGLNVLVAAGKLIWKHDYKFDMLPIARFRWCPGFQGPYSTGLGQALEGQHMEIQHLLERIQGAQQLMAVPRVWISKAANVNVTEITNAPGGLCFYDGDPSYAPKTDVSPSMHPEIYQWVQTLWQRGFETSGISVMSATSKKPSGLDSGQAIREYRDVGSERFAHISEEHGRFYMQIAELLIQANKELASTGKWVVNLDGGRHGFRTMDWSDVDMDRDIYAMRIHPTNFLPEEPAARKQAAVELMQYGGLPVNKLVQVMNYPDLEAIVEDDLWPSRAVDSDLEFLLDGGEAIMPEGWMDLVHAKTKGTALLSKMRNQTNVPDEIRDAIMKYVSLADHLQRQAEEKAAAMMQAAQPMGPPMPGAPPGAPPLPPM